MRFLALTGIQGTLLALLTASVIVSLYFLKHRRRRILISSTQLWKRVLENRLENSLFERLRRYISILIAVITALLIALAVARPEVPWLTGESPRTLLVLDTSPSMDTKTRDGSSRWQHAVELAKALISGGSGSAQFRVADTAGQFDSPFTDKRPELRRVLESMHPVFSTPRFPEVDVGTGDVDIAVVFITDGVSGVSAPENSKVLSVFEEAPNTGITAFEIRAVPTSPLSFEAYLEIFNAGETSRSVEVTISGTEQQRLVKSVQVDAGSSYHETLDLSEFEGGGIRAAIRSDGDAFPADDIAYAYLPENRRSKVLLVTRGNKFLESALRLDRLVDLTIVDPRDFDGGSEFDALVLDRFAPVEAPARPTLVVGTPVAPWLRPAARFVGNPRFETWDETHPVLQHVSLFDVGINSAAILNAEGLQVLAASGSGVPLIIAFEQPRRIQLTFDVQNSDFPYHASFPIFLDNALAWFGREHLAWRRTPGIVEIPLEDVAVRTIDGRNVSTQRSGTGTIFEAAEPGLYVAGNEGSRQYVALNVESRDVSDINHSIRQEKSADSAASPPFFRHELWFYMLCAALLLIAAEWYTYHRRITL